MSDGNPSNITPPTTEQLLKRIETLEAGQDELKSMLIHQAEMIDRFKRVFQRIGGITQTLNQSDVVK